MSSNVVTLVETDNYIVRGEEKDGLVFLHCDVENFNKTVLKEMREVFKEILSSFYFGGYDEVFTYVEKDKAKFSHTIKPAEVISSFTNLGKEYEVLRWDLKQL